MSTIAYFYKFPIELTILILLRIFKSPLLENLQDYQLIKMDLIKFINIYYMMKIGNL